MTQYIAIFRCCRDWPMYPMIPMGRCGLCGERPIYTDKTVAQYMAEREQIQEEMQ